MSVKCFYLVDGEFGGYASPDYHESNLIQVTLNNLGKQGIHVRDRENVLSDEDVKRYKMIRITDPEDSFEHYIIKQKESIRLFLNEKRCRVLCTDTRQDSEYDDTNIIEGIVKSACEVFEKRKC